VVFSIVDPARVCRNVNVGLLRGGERPVPERFTVACPVGP
jgi:hypothetical protein